MDNNKMTLINLPWADILFKNVLFYLDLKDLFNLRFVSKSYKNLVESYFRKCMEINLARNKNLNADAFKVLSECCRNVKYLNISKCNWMYDYMLIPFLLNNSHIIEIDLSYCNAIGTKSMQALILNCKNLQVLRMADCRWLLPGTLDALMYHQDNLASVDFSRCILLFEKCIIKFIIKFSDLKDLSLAYIPSVTDDTLHTISNSCEYLEYLNITGCIVTDSAVRSLVLNCKRLKSIKITGTILTREQFRNFNKGTFQELDQRKLCSTIY